MKKQPDRAVLITDAARSQSEQLRSREVRYVIMMSLRGACLITGAILVSVRPPLLALWLVLCAAGMVFLPWAAVLVANDRPPRTPAERAAARPRPGPAALEQPRAERHRTIDVEP